MTFDWLIWQLADSGFPAGGFAHSSGMEACVQWGEVAAAKDVLAFARAAILQVGRSAVPIVAAACAERDRYESLDHLSQAMLANHVANRASRAQGQAMLKAVGRIFPHEELARLILAVRERRLPGHFAPVFGAVAGILGVSRERAAQVYMYVSLRGLLSAAVRLGVVGPMEGQAIQHELGAEATAVAERCGRLGVDEAAQTSPLIDLLQGSQDRLYSRLFQS